MVDSCTTKFERMPETHNSEPLTRISEELKSRYEHPAAALVPLLFAVQARDGHVTPEAEREVAELLGVDRTRVHEAVTFYPLLFERPIGKHLIQVCHNISCSLLGAEPLIELLERELGINAGETTPDGLFTLIRAECLGCCGDAPVMLVGEKLYTRLTAEKVRELVAKYRAGEVPEDGEPLTETNEIENPALSFNFKVPNAADIRIAENLLQAGLDRESDGVIADLDRKYGELLAGKYDPNTSAPMGNHSPQTDREADKSPNNRST